MNERTNLKKKVNSLLNLSSISSCVIDGIFENGKLCSQKSI